jgi:hypothetical protein
VADYTKMAEVLSGVLHPRVADVLAAFLPGLFFEGCVALACPQKVQAVLTNSRLDHASQIFLALVFGFILGSAFMLWVRLIQRTFLFIAAQFHWLRTIFVEKHLNLWANKWQQKSRKELQPGQKPPSPPLWVKFAKAAWRKQEQYHGLSTAIKENWDLVATALLRRYGVSAPRRINSLWANAIGGMPSDELRGFPLIMSLHAAGWAGLAAIRLAPNLSSLPFKSLCLFLIFAGLVHCVLLASWLTHPVKSWVTGLKSTLDELKELGPVPNEALLSRPDDGRVPDRD